MFDNTHYNRDRSTVPSDLEQMPHLLNFLKGNGTLLTNNHTILISHTAGGILTSMTGLYPDRNGQTVSNGYGYFDASAKPAFSSSFKYWTDTVDGADDSLPNMVSDGGQTTTPPWQAFTNAGCNVGGVSAANIELENTSTAPAGDMTRVFGSGSPQSVEAAANPTQALADFVGIAIHCAKSAALCNTPDAKPDDATVYPGSDNGFKALFGAKYVNPAITGGQPCVNDTAGHPIKDVSGTCGFPGFDGALAKNTLGMVAQMQEHGVPVTYAYISDAHDNHTLGRASGPGEADYKQQLADYDAAFAMFFQRLASDGITKDNTLFVVTADEGDHFAGGTGTPQPDGSLAYSHTNCTVLTACPANQIGEVNVKVQSITPAGSPSFSVHADDAPTFYVNGNPTRTDPTLRKLERDLGGMSIVDPYAGGVRPDHATHCRHGRGEDAAHGQRRPETDADLHPVRERRLLLHRRARCSAARTSASTRNSPGTTATTRTRSAIRSSVSSVRACSGSASTTASGPTTPTRRPTMLSILGLTDSYTMDGRVITQILVKRRRRRAAALRQRQR